VLSINAAADSNGYLSTSAHALSTDGNALITPDIKLHLGNGDWIPGNWSGQIKVTSTNGQRIFVGIGPTAQVKSYLNDVTYDTVTNWGWGSNTDPRYSAHIGGGNSVDPPGQQTFWASSQEGTGTQVAGLQLKNGDWTAVVMNADGSAPVAASVSLGVHIGILLPLGIGLTVGGIVLLAVGILLVVLGAKKPRGQAQPGYGYPGGPPQPPYGQQPYGQQYAPPPYGQPAQPPWQQPPQQPYQAPYQPPTAPPPVAPPGDTTDGRPPTNE
jgi:hypothetical protein